MASTTNRRRSTKVTTPRSPAPLVIECVRPELDSGRYPVKRVVGDAFEVRADILKDGHDLLSARIRYSGPADEEWRTVPMHYEQNADQWVGGFKVDRAGRWVYTVEAWTDRFGTWRSELQKKVGAGQDVSSELLEGAELLDAAARRARFGDARNALRAAALQIHDTDLPGPERIAAALDGGLHTLFDENYSPLDLTSYSRELEVWVDRERAAFASWYELFPRSQTNDPRVHGTFLSTARALPRIAALGFDVVYLPPVHPVGISARKGPNNSLAAGPDDPGSPWAIGNEVGGHTSVEPKLGTLADFDTLVAAAAELGLEIALDYALQCSPDHPWLKAHPEWFFVRPDGTIKYAENPPKKYQDIYPLNFWCEDRDGLWNACRDIFLFWAEHGVRMFRVDNPHTKPFAFWEWVINAVHARYPDVVFLAEAFTRPRTMKLLAKLGFTQSYTYFTWKNTASELRSWWAEMHSPAALEYMRGNLFANTPDILHEYLQAGGRPAFRVRLMLAATMSPLYGIYSGFELAENTPVRAGSEEYLDSEKYQIRVRDWDAPGNLNADITLLNTIRRDNPALHRMDNLTFRDSENTQILFFTKTAPGWRNDLLIIVNLDPSRAQETVVTVPLAELGLDPDIPYVVEDLLTGARYSWRGARNYVRLDPNLQPGHILRLQR
ncbi:MAG: alpha-1,4-glucan--maltose-1-phosphate maltosyltransferase [Gemmatimonas sp.]|nr:alpha-1,4-glucan--maltose-1-phosphate maltosyltransferase [Gemmatimonadaceae bacterium]